MSQLDLFGALAAPVRKGPEASPPPVAVVGAAPCRVLACPQQRRGAPCPEHDTPAVAAMGRPHVYVFGGQRIALESMTWAQWDALAPAAEPVPISPPADPTPPLVDIQPTEARRCWEWCGRGAPARDVVCHPASVWSRPPLYPCFACGRKAFPCHGVGMSCSAECSSFYRDVIARAPADVAATWLDFDHHEHWLERCAVMAEGMTDGRQLLMVERRALLDAWRLQGDVG